MTLPKNRLDHYYLKYIDAQKHDWMKEMNSSLVKPRVILNISLNFIGHDLFYNSPHSSYW